MVGEAEAMKLGVKLVYNLGYRNILLEGDSATVISAFNNFPEVTDWRIHSIVTDSFETIRLLQSWSFTHICREANDVVHHLARWPPLSSSQEGISVLLSVFRIFPGCLLELIPLKFLESWLCFLFLIKLMF